MQGIILYKSKYGATKKYALWLAELTGFDCMPLADFETNNFSSYDTVILGGGVYASGIACIPFLKKNFPKLRGKKILVYTCGASPYDKKCFDELVNHNMKEPLANIPVFYCRGGFDMPAMSLKDRMLCKMLRKAVSKKDPADYEVWEKAIMEVSETESCDWTDKSYLEPLLDYLKAE